MWKVWCIALTTVALAASYRPARADEPAIQQAPVAEAPAMQCPGQCECGPPKTAVEFLSRHVRRCPTCGGAMNGSDCGSCAECGKRQKKVARFLDWLIYVPEDHGKTKCCRPCDSCPPPAWAFFPCEGGGRCNTCVASAATIYYAKAPGATTTSQVVQTAYPPKATPKPAEQPPRVSTYSPQALPAKMPVLDPTQFRKQPGTN
jgi:hypothetical protein